MRYSNIIALLAALSSGALSLPLSPVTSEQEVRGHDNQHDADAAYGVYERRHDADAAYGVYEKRQDAAAAEKRHDADAAYGVYEKRHSIDTNL